MDHFPEFMKPRANRIAASSQVTAGVEGFVFDGADGSQMAFWTCRKTALSTLYVHDFDECMIVVRAAIPSSSMTSAFQCEPAKSTSFQRGCGMAENPWRAPGLFTLSADGVPREFINRVGLSE
jgi:hypothetical protein